MNTLVISKKNYDDIELRLRKIKYIEKKYIRGIAIYIIITKIIPTCFFIYVILYTDTTKCIQIYTSSKIKNIHININI